MIYWNLESPGGEPFRFDSRKQNWEGGLEQKRGLGGYS